MRKNCKGNRKHKSDSSSESEPEPDDDISDVSQELSIPIAKLPEQLQNRKIVINISDTQYPIIEEIAEDLDWEIETGEGNGEWDIWWTDHEVNPQVLFRMNLQQKINHYPGIYVLARKNLLGMNLMAMQQKFPQQYDFFPETWVLPLEFPKFMRYFEENKKNQTYIVKPEALSQGKGIFLTRNIEDLMNGRKYVVQRYIPNPYLIDHLKFDLRIYVLIAGTDPLRLYIYEEGLTRLATKAYEQPNEQNMQNSYIHLTNYSLNKNNPDYVYNESEQQMDVGHKRTLSSTYDYLQKNGHDTTQLKSQINEMIVKTVIAGLPAISHQYRYCQPEEYQGNMCFHILGIDAMITSELKPYLIEINHTPSFETSTPLDYKIKKGLITDTFQLMRINSKKKKYLFERAKEVVKKRVETGKREIIKGEARNALIEESRRIRDNEQQQILGGFTRIYPFEQEIQSQIKIRQYEEMIKHSETVHKDTHEARKKLIREGQDRTKAKERSDKNEKNQKNQKTQRNQVKTGNKSSNKSHRNQSNILENRHKQSNFESPQIKSKSIKFQPLEMHLKNKQKKQIGERKASVQYGKSINILNQHEQDLIQFNTISKITNAHRYEQKTFHNSNFRMKTKKVIHSTTKSTAKDELEKVGDFMLRYLGTYNMNPTEIDDKTFSILNRIAERKKKETNLRTNYGSKQVGDKKNESNFNREGAFIVPKTYDIVNDRMGTSSNVIHSKIIYDKEIQNCISFESKRSKALEVFNSISVGKKKRNSVV